MGIRLRKITIYTLSFIVLIISLLVLAPLFVPVELYKDEVIAKIEDATGRNLEINGDIGLRFIPSLQLKLGDVHFSNPEGFANPDQKDMIALQQLQLSLGLFELLQGRIAIEKLHLNNPVIYLGRDAKNRPNWEFKTAKEAANELDPSQTDSSSAPDADKYSIPNLEIINGTIIYQETIKSEPISLNQLHATIKMPSLDDQITVDANTFWNNIVPLKLNIKLNTLASWMKKEDTAYAITLSTEKGLGELSLEGTATPANSTNGYSNQIKGEGHLAVDSLKELSTKLGKPLFATAPGKAKLSVRSMYNYSKGKASLQGTSLTLDDMTVSGRGDVSFSGKRPTITAELSTQDVLKLDSVINRGKPSITGPQANANTPLPIEQPESQWSTDVLINDTAILKAVDADIDVHIGGVKANKVTLGEMQINSRLNNGVLTVSIPSFDFYGGKATSNFSLEPTGKTALRVQKNAQISNANIGDFLRDAYGFDRLKGHGQLELALSMEGASLHDYVNSLRGNGNFALKDGAITGFDLVKIVREAKTLVKTIKNDAITAQMGDKPQTVQTDFSSLNGSFTLTKGVATNPDFRLKAPLLNVTGSGTVNIPEKTVDYNLRPTIIGTLEGQSREESSTQGVTIPIHVTGNFDALKFTPNAKALVEDAIEDPKGTLKNIETNVRGLRDEVKTLFKGL